MRKKSEERRQAIIDIAAEIFNEIGFERASMAEISARLGGSKATLYNYFSSKEEIFLLVMRQQAGVEFDAIFAILKEVENTRSGLQQFATKYLQLVLSPEVITLKRLVAYHAERSALGCSVYENGPKRGLRGIADYLQRAMEKGDLRTSDAWLAALQFKALVEAEWMERRVLNVVEKVTTVEIEASVERAISGFFAIHGA